MREIKDKTFAKVSISKVTGSKHNLFGSHRQHEQVIELTVSGASMTREYGMTRTYREKDIIVLHMSMTQYAEMLTNMNDYSGADATIVYTQEDGYLASPVQPSLDDMQKFEMGQKLQGVLEIIEGLKSEVESLQSGKSLSATKRKELMSNIEGAEREVKANLPFLMTQFSQEIDKTVNDAKFEAQSRLQEQFSDLKLRGGEVQSLLGAPRAKEED